MFPKAAASERAEGSLPERGPGRAGMAAAAAGPGAWAAQEKQFPPALLSFFIYNPRFGPREGEVSGGRGKRRGPQPEEGPGPATRRCHCLGAADCVLDARGPLAVPALAEPAPCWWLCRAPDAAACPGSGGPRLILRPA